MDSPAMFIRGSAGRLEAARPVFRGCDPARPPEWIPLDDALSGIDRSVRRPFVAIDSDSLALGALGTEVMKNLKVRGMDIWLMATVETTDDVLDAFNMGADKLMVPLDRVRSMKELRDMNSVSDSIIPTMFCVSDGVRTIGGVKPVLEALDEMADEGFFRCCIVDPGDTVDWDAVLEENPSAVPFTAADVPGEGIRIKPALRWPSRRQRWPSRTSPRWGTRRFRRR